MRYMGIDFGSKRIGIAISDEEGNMAFPETVIENKNKNIEEIFSIIQKKEIGAIVIGESKDYQGKDNEIMGEIRNFVKKISSKTKLPIYFEPEFMTSAQAERLQGKNEFLDASAATIILQSYLDKKVKNKE